MICRNHQTADSRGVIPTFHQCKPSTSLWDGQSVLLIKIPTFQHSEELTGKLAVSWSYLYVQERVERQTKIRKSREGWSRCAARQAEGWSLCGRLQPRSGRCALSRGEGMERRTERERERTSEGREGRKGEREGLISSSLSNETIGEELPPVWSGPKAVGTRKTRGKKVGRREAGTIQALADSHTVSSGKDREFWIQQKRLPPSLPPSLSRTLSVDFMLLFCVVETFPSFPPTILLFLLKQETFSVTRNLNRTHT